MGIGNSGRRRKEEGRIEGNREGKRGHGAGGGQREGGRDCSSPTANRANGQLAYLWRLYFRYMNWFPSKVRDASFPAVQNV